MGESPFAALRLLRTDAEKRFKKVANATAVVWKMLLVAERKFRRLNSPELLPAVAAGQQVSRRPPGGRRLICLHTLLTEPPAAREGANHGSYQNPYSALAIPGLNRPTTLTTTWTPLRRPLSSSRCWTDAGARLCV